MNVLVVDVGGTNVKVLASGQAMRRKFPSGPEFTPGQMLYGVLRDSADWPYDVVSIGLPTPVEDGRPVKEPDNLGPGWVGFDFAAAFGKPVKLINDAAMQALGSYDGGKMLFIGLGTGLGSAVISDGVLQPMENGDTPYKQSTYEDYVGTRGLQRLGVKKWRTHVEYVVNTLKDQIKPDYVVLGGGNVRELKELPPDCRAGSNANAFVGGFRLWNKDCARVLPTAKPTQS